MNYIYRLRSFLNRSFDKTNKFSESVKEFNKAYNLDSKKLQQSPDERIGLLSSLIDEEYKELNQALEERDITEVFDACGDLLYVVIGFCVRLEIPIDEIFDRVHESNMSKLDKDGNPIYNEKGKVQKGPNFFKPNFTDLVEDYVSDSQ